MPCSIPVSNENAEELGTFWISHSELRVMEVRLKPIFTLKNHIAAQLDPKKFSILFTSYCIRAKLMNREHSVPVFPSAKKGYDDT